MIYIYIIDGYVCIDICDMFDKKQLFQSELIGCSLVSSSIISSTNFCCHFIEIRSIPSAFVKDRSFTPGHFQAYQVTPYIDEFGLCIDKRGDISTPWKIDMLTPNMEVWKMIFLFQLGDF